MSTAWGVLTLATAHMAEMVRLATLRRGLDPRDFALVAFGGAGPLHAGEIAREVGIPTVIVPPFPGLFSVIGTALCDARHDLVQTLVRLTERLGPHDLATAFRALEGRAHELIAAEEVGDPGGWILERHADLRFERQMHELTLPVQGEASGPALEAALREAHVGASAYDLPDNPVMLVSGRSITAWRISSRVHPVLRAFLACEWTAPSSLAPVEIASFIRALVLSSRGPEL